MTRSSAQIDDGTTRRPAQTAAESKKGDEHMTRTYIAATALIGALAATGAAQTTARVVVAPDSKLWE